MKSLAKSVCLFLFLAAATDVAYADVKIKSRSNAGGQNSESITYIKGKRQRAEYGPTVSITQCDLRRTLQLNVPAKVYTVTPFNQPNAATTPEAKTASAPQQQARRGGVVTTTMTSVDTGERKQFFGLTARRIKSSMVTESTPNACNPMKSRMETDGWYIDAQFALDCDSGIFGGFTPPARPDGCRDEYRMKQLGMAKIGYPVLITTTMFDEGGQPSFSFTQEVVEFSQAALDPSLFEVPADFREVDQSALYGASAYGAMLKNSSDNAPSDENDASSTGNPASSSTTSNTPGEKRTGVLRVGVAVTQATTAGNITREQLAGALSESLVAQITGPSIESIALTSESPQQLEDEARRKQCDFVLYLAATHKKGGGGGGFGGFLKKAAPVAGVIAPVNTETAIASNVVYSAASVAAEVKSKDELVLEYTLQRIGASTIAAASTLRAKAKRDGEDILTPLTTQTASVVMVEVSKN
jgi:hypothetical protein